MLENLDKQQITAGRAILEYAGIEPTDENLRRYLLDEVVTFTEDGRGRYVWYMDDDGNEACLHVETLEDIDVSEVNDI